MTKEKKAEIISGLAAILFMALLIFLLYQISRLVMFNG